MKSRLSILFGVAILIACGTYTATRAFDPPKDGEGTKATKESKEEPAKAGSKSRKSSALAQSKKMIDPFNKLSREEALVILEKHTEPQNRGYTNSKVAGTYICKRCNAPLYNSTDKFESHCGWPSFDDEIKGAVKRQLDADGMRVEIVCSNCDGHLGHVFQGEGFTPKNTRHCVNSISMKLIPKGKEMPKVIRADGSEEATEQAKTPELKPSADEKKPAK